MDIRELRSFVLLAEELHFGRAARVLNLSQPALTKQIRRMEDDLGASLFDRGKQGTHLSAFGVQFLKQARHTLASFDQLLESGRRAAIGETGRLRIGFGFHTFELVPRLIVKLRQLAPSIEVSLRDMSSDEQVTALNADEIDIGFVRTPVQKDFKTLPVVRDRIAFVSSIHSPLPTHIRLADFRNEPFVALSEARAPGFYHHLLTLCALAGFRPRIVQEVPEFTTAIALVRAGLGVAAISESFWNSHLEGIRLHHLKEKQAGWQVSAAWRGNDSNPVLQRFIGLLKEDLKTAKREV